ncbi:MAG: DnaA N-terminal domain-containing protein, partial [Dehalococcoidia bacterium]
MQERSAKALWQAALGQLQLQVTRPNYETWLRDTSGLNLDDGVFTIGVPTDFIAEWLN